jgi:hypothetical protein
MLRRLIKAQASFLVNVLLLPWPPSANYGTWAGFAHEAF